jgi:hypothetical protein
MGADGMISKRTFGALDLKSVTADCANCGVKHDITKPVDREGMRGVSCGHCLNILWMTSIRHIYIPSSDPGLSAEEHIARRKRQDRDFFDTLPACPYCAARQWESFLEDFKFPPDCRACGNPFTPGIFRDNTDMRSNETAYWYEID